MAMKYFKWTKWFGRLRQTSTCDILSNLQT